MQRDHQSICFSHKGTLDHSLFVRQCLPNTEAGWANKPVWLVYGAAGGPGRLWNLWQSTAGPDVYFALSTSLCWRRQVQLSLRVQTGTRDTCPWHDQGHPYLLSYTDRKSKKDLPNLQTTGPWQGRAGLEADKEGVARQLRVARASP